MRITPFMKRKVLQKGLQLFVLNLCLAKGKDSGHWVVHVSMWKTQSVFITEAAMHKPLPE